MLEDYNNSTLNKLNMNLYQSMCGLMEVFVFAKHLHKGGHKK